MPFDKDTSGCEVIDGDILDNPGGYYFHFLVVGCPEGENFQITLKLIIIEIMGMVWQFLL
jgi:hypothetical protein